MLTNQRRYEIIKACKEIISSPNFNELGKKQAKFRMEQMYRELSIFGD